MNDLESCGGCIGLNMPGVDCTADVHAASVSCVMGRCVVGTWADLVVVMCTH